MRILVAYDGSSGADDAVAGLSRAGLPADAEALVLAVAPDCGPPPGPPSRAATFGARAPGDRERIAVEHAAAVAALGEQRVRREFPEWRVSHRGMLGDAAAAVRDAASAWRADLVVAGAQARRRPGGVPAFGSTARRVLAEAPCSVRVGRAPGRAPRSGPARLVVGHDGSPGADLAIDTIAARRWPEGSSARVISVVDASSAPAAGAVWRTLRERTAGAAARLRAAGLLAEADVVIGDARTTLADEAARTDADVVFVGARGAGAPGEFLVGSAAAATASRAPCAVEVVRPRSAEEPST